MKIIYTLLTLTLSLVTYKAQQTYPLNTYYGDVSDYSYMKDLNNELTPYIGTYKATFEGNEITLTITKEDKRLQKILNNRYYMDVLNIKYIIKNIATGIILEDNLNPVDQDLNEMMSMGTNPKDNNTIDFHYTGGRCSIGWGRITLLKINDTQVKWAYYPNSVLLSDSTCPNSGELKIYLPDTRNLIFTKQ
ncbi:DUF6705 family protein [Chryseobacterium sp. CT-SW4]|uniref:DUF6705 family protein n=1 Tax=Chryseobacterium sp. SW-1 TaxID=3157343 RepID=UPI003B02238E